VIYEAKKINFKTLISTLQISLELERLRPTLSAVVPIYFLSAKIRKYLKRSLFFVTELELLAGTITIFYIICVVPTDNLKEVSLTYTRILMYVHCVNHRRVSDNNHPG
jgi:hypothetical protein